MKTKYIFLPFDSNREFLKEKWWHRLFSVLFVISIILFTLGTVFVSSESVSDNTFNSKVRNNLKVFSASSDVSLSNTIPNFLKQDSKFGCLQDGGKINYVSTYSLGHSSFCSADIKSHLSDVADVIIQNHNPHTKDSLIAALTEILRRDTAERYCFIDTEIISCASDKIVAYNHSIVFYLQIGVYSLIATYLFSIFLQLLYFKGLIYIIYGRK